MIQRITAVAAPLVLLAGVVAAVVEGGEARPGPTQARLEVVDGSATVTGADGIEREVTDDATLDRGDQVEVVDGTAVLELADGATYELRHHAGTGSAVVVGSPPLVLAGQVLVSDGFPARVGVGAATLSARGAVKVDAEQELASVYDGGAGVAGAGEVAELAALRQLVLVPGAAPEPLAFDGTDPWDRRFLGEAIAFGERLEALARGYTSDLPAGGGRTAEFFRAVIPVLADEREFNDDLLDPARPPGETLVGAVIAAQGRRGTFRERWAEVFAFRDAGAAWGLVALDQGVGSAPVLETIELAIDASSSAGTADGEASSTTSSSDPTSASPGTTSTSGPPPTTTSQPPPEPEPEPSDGLLEPVSDPASDLLEGLFEPERTG